MPNPSPIQLVISSAVMPDGSYGAEVTVGDDVAWTLWRGAAIRYAVGVVAAATQAEFDAKLLAVLRGTGMGDQLAGSLVGDVRADRGAESTLFGSTKPLTLIPGVSAFTAQPFIAVHHDQHPGWQWSPDEARVHALGVLEAVAAAEEDNRAHTILTGTYGVDSNTARGVLDAMRRQQL